MNIYKFDKRYKIIKSSDNENDSYILEFIDMNNEKDRMGYICDSNLNIELIFYKYNNKFDNSNSPSIICFHENSEIQSIEYWINGKSHRVYGPSDFNYDINGNLEEIIWFYKDRDYTYEVNEWISENGFNSWEDMTENDYNRMWMEIL